MAEKELVLLTAEGQELQLQAFFAPLLAWYDRERREMPWRTHPSPYRIWVSEIMLQQTRVSAAIPYFERFVTTLPDVAALAAADEQTLHKLWEGLGYYSRVRNMQRAAQQIMQEHGGQLPADFEALLSLPGIGEYTAGAIAATAFGLRVPAVDGNVMRVLSRLFLIGADIAQPRSKRLFTQVSQALLPYERVGDYDQAVMELGATVCIPNGAPLCDRCPLAGICQAHLQGMTEHYPVKSPKKGRRIEQLTVVLLHDARRILLQHRPEQGLLAGLWGFPCLPGWQTPEQVLAFLRSEGLVPIQASELDASKHIFTQVEWRMKGMCVQVEQLPDWPDHTAFTRTQIEQELAIPSAFRAYQAMLPTLL